MRIILASASPRRKELLSKITDDFTVCPVDAPEREYGGLPPKEKALRRAKDKCLRALCMDAGFRDRAVITSDTIVDVDGEDLGKPKDRYDVFRMIKLISGRKHLVHTAVCVCYGGFMYTFVDTTLVELGYVDEEEIIRYAATDEPYDKAGAYAVQGYMGRYLLSMKGDYDNVMGFPTSRVRKLLKQLGAEVRG